MKSPKERAEQVENLLNYWPGNPNADPVNASVSHAVRINRKLIAVAIQEAVNEALEEAAFLSDKECEALHKEEEKLAKRTGFQAPCIAYGCEHSQLAAAIRALKSKPEEG